MELIKCFKALSDKTRVRLLSMLNEYELNVNEVVQVVDMVQSGISRHLKILVESGLLISRRDANFIYYSAAKTDIADKVTALIKEHRDEDLVFSQDITAARNIIQERKNNTRQFFNTIAPQWDELKKEVMGGFNLDGIIKEKIGNTPTVLDLGCGTGALLATLSQGKARSLIGVDSSPQMLALARSRLSGNPLADLRLGELEHIPLKNNAVDCAVMNMVLHHISQPGQSISEAWRVLKPGGMFILTDFQKHENKDIIQKMGGAWSGFEPQKICQWLEDTGFSLVNTESYPVNFGLQVNLFIAEKQLKN